MTSQTVEVMAAAFAAAAVPEAGPLQHLVDIVRALPAARTAAVITELALGYAAACTVMSQAEGLDPWKSWQQGQLQVQVPSAP
jgi:type IV secretory pathway VirB2 component (pilin)